MEGDEGLRTVECLRGRLLAERAASKAANHESQQITKKVTELEKQLKMEIKSRNRAEKRLKFLMKKLASLNILADESSTTCDEKSEVSSVSSSNSQPQKVVLFQNISKCDMNNDASGERHNCPSHGNQSREKVGDEYDLHKKNYKNNGSKTLVTQKDSENEEHYHDRYHNVDSSMALKMIEEKLISKPVNEQDHDVMYDDSMALVVVDSIVEEEKKDNVLISNGNVKDVLDALRYARECLQISIDMRSHIDSISC